MTALLRAELLKQRTTRTTAGLLAIMCALVLFAVLLHSLGLDAGAVRDRDGQMHVIGFGGLGGLFAALAGAVSITGEFRYGTIRPTLMATPRRARIVAAKAGVACVVGVGFGIVAEALAIATGMAALDARGITIELDAGDYAQLISGGAFAAALWAQIGLAVGALVRNQVAALVGLLAWVLFVESLLFGVLPDEGRFLPGIAGAGISGVTNTGEVTSLLSPAAGATLLAAYAAGALAAGAIATARRDVP
jgi:ABC-2 type transport system permease protein